MKSNATTVPFLLRCPLGSSRRFAAAGALADWGLASELITEPNVLRPVGDSPCRIPGATEQDEHVATAESTPTAAARRRPAPPVSVALSGRDEMRTWTHGSLLVVVFVPVVAVLDVPPLPLMAALHEAGIIVPSCGLTRGLRAVARVDLAEAWRWNPASLFVAFATSVGLARALVGGMSGRWLTLRLSSARWLWALAGGALALLWANQWAQATLLAVD